MKYRGADFLVQVLADDGITWLSATSDRSTSITIGNEFTDTTAKGASGGQWRESAVAAGIRSSDVTCAGLVVDGAGAYSKLMARGFDGAAFRMRVIHGDTQEVILDGRTIALSVERSGEYNGAEQYAVSMSSAALQSTIPLSVVSSVSAASANVPSFVTFSATIMGGVAPFTYAWTFSDSTTSTSAAPIKLINVLGPLTATVIVTDSTGATATSGTASTTGVGTQGARVITGWAIGLTVKHAPKPHTATFTTRTVP